MARIKFLNTYIDSLTMGEAVDEIDRLIVRREHTYAVTPNILREMPEYIVGLSSHKN